MKNQINGSFVIIDAMNVFLRNYCKSSIMDANGRRIGGTVGSLVSIRKLLKDFKASNALVVWDGEGGSQRRKAIFSEYKAGRTIRMNRRDDDMEEDPEEQLKNLREQIQLTKELLTLAGIPQVRCEGVEADDVMAYLGALYEHPGDIIIVTTDQDLLQLVRDENKSNNDLSVFHSAVKVWSPVKKIMFDRNTFIEHYGVLPENFRFVKALTGDNSDNIDGIKGFGTKTINKLFPELLQRKIEVDEFVSFFPRVKGVLGKRLTNEIEIFMKNMELVDLSKPLISMHSSRESRIAAKNPLSCKEVDFRVKVIKEGLLFGDNFFGPIRDFSFARKRLLANDTSSETDF